MRFLLISLILLTSCGKNADSKTAQSVILDHERPLPINRKLTLSDMPREILLFAFPNQNEVADFSFDHNHKLWNEEEMKDVLSLVDYGDQYLFEIPRDLSPEKKVQGIIGKILAISDARDESLRKSDVPKKMISSLTQEMREKFNQDFPCFEVTKKESPNYKKCYLMPIPNVTKPTPTKWRFETCKGLKDAVESFSNIAADALATSENYRPSPQKIEDVTGQLPNCMANEDLVEKFKALHGTGKTLAAVLIGAAEEKLPHDKLIFTAKSELDDLDGPDMPKVSFDIENFKFGEFSVPIDFNDGEGPVVYSPDRNNMTVPTVTEINSSGLFRVDFEIRTPLFTLKTLGLSLDLDPVIGLRVSGRTRLYYPDGHTRDGILRIDLPIQE
jgi:hypothetical protein